MMRKYGLWCASILACACMCRGELGDVMAESAGAATFDVYTSADATYAALTADELSAMRITYREGETVTATAYDGTLLTLVGPAASSGSVQFDAGKGGIWTLVNSEQGMARIGVSWSINADYGAVVAQSANSSCFGVDSKEAGPDRRTHRESVLPIAYAGDGWSGSPSKESVLTVVSPDGSSTVLSRAGTGVEPWPFNKFGEWTITLASADAGEMTAKVLVVGGFRLRVR